MMFYSSNILKKKLKRSHITYFYLIVDYSFGECKNSEWQSIRKVYDMENEFFTLDIRVIHIGEDINLWKEFYFIVFNRGIKKIMNAYREINISKLKEKEVVIFLFYINS